MLNYDKPEFATPLTVKSAQQIKDAQAEAYALNQWGKLYRRRQLINARSLQKNRIDAIVGGISQSRHGFSALPAVESEVKQISL
ncbi:hypothetical protein [Nostoc sp. NZL]|uniref:hypothetical protein n=1 Tax=Nostoc sp. NZL TaxID=2650612 RepID=UPI0018C6B313|nr:hypothetical protein [Nostoc sp. NZL]MBG1241220.1 hypothetical protein [Nostoc sp. NZL]